MSRYNRTHFAGAWYSGDQNELTKSMETAVERSMAKIDGRGAATWTRPTGAVLPHAGLSYSARGIAHAFQPTVRPYSRIVILSPSHYHPLSPNAMWVEGFDRHETPLGDLSGDPSFSHRLAAQLGDEIVFADDVIEREHGTEMFLPFIKWHSPDARISMVLVPVVDDEAVLSRWAQAMGDLLDLPGEDTLLVMSSDFSHYGPRFGYTPFRTPSAEHDAVLKAVEDDDLRVAQTIADRDVDALLCRMQRPITICGRYPILLGSMLLNAREARTGTIGGAVVDYYTSLAVTGSTDLNFVCYATILFGSADALPDGTVTRREVDDGG